jgi:N-acetylmuramoyl-L-alanine amidase
VGRCLGWSLVRRSITTVVATLGIAAIVIGCGDTRGTPTRTRSTDVPPVARTGAIAQSVSTTTVERAPRPLQHRTHASVPKPRIVWDPIPFGSQRKAEMAAYVQRHYGSFMKPTWQLISPHVIVIHYTGGPTFQSAWNTFADDVPDAELHELPGTCAQFVVDTSGTIYQLVSLGTMCRHTVGLNWTAIGIEHVGYSDAQILDDRMQMSASLHLVRWLRCRYGIPIKDVIGHNESLASPFHHEGVLALRTQTHDDFNRSDMQIYRARSRAAGPC